MCSQQQLTNDAIVLYAFLERDTSVTTGTGDDGRRAYSSTPAYYHTLAETTVAAC